MKRRILTAVATLLLLASCGNKNDIKIEGTLQGGA